MIDSSKKSLVQEISFASDHYSLKGCLHLPPVDKPPLVIGLHGLFSDKNSPKQIHLAKQCNRNRIAFFRFDHRGCGESDAPFEEKTSLNGRCTDLIAAVNMLKARADLGTKLGLFGSSMGGAVCLAAARDIKPVTIVTWAAPVRSIDIVGGRADRKNTENSHNPFKKSPFDISDQLSNIRNILILHGEADETVPRCHAAEIFEHVKEPKKLIFFPHSDHRMSRPDDQQEFIRRAASWFQSYLKPA
ncbi:MAG: alpha/beta fold hydrolase [Desulfobacterales bacterium]|jgi:alpha-beta hydrolase superfamily lysophospholipase